jgi:hypothetical protein
MDRQHVAVGLYMQNVAYLGIVGQLAVALKRKVKKRRRYWVRPWIERRVQFGFYHQLMQELRIEDSATFTNFLRMPPHIFDELLTILYDHLVKKTTKMRDPLEPGLKLAMTLRHLATGATYTSMQYGWRVPPNTISVVVREVCNVINQVMRQQYVKCPVVADEWKVIADQFWTRWNFPHTCGAIDGKHIAIKKPNNSGSLYFNYKGFFSIVILAVVDADYKFLWVDIGSRGASSDAQIYNNSELKECVEDNSICFPDPDILPNDTGKKMLYFLVGDDAFALKETMMKPFSRRGLSMDETIFNYRLSRCRRIVENAFGILANRWQINLNIMGHEPATCRLLVTSCIILHNFLRIKYPSAQNRQLDSEDASHNIIPGEWRRGRNMSDIENVVAPNTGSLKAKKMRLYLKHYVNSAAGSVAWQNSMV